MSEPKFKVGQVLIYTSGKKLMPFIVKQIIHEYDAYFYRFDRKNCVAEANVRALTEEEKG